MTTNVQKPATFNKKTYLIGTIIILILVAMPLLTIHNADFGGTDDLASETIETLAPNYNYEWISNWWEPASETESALFALQAATGGILIGYAMGYWKGRKNRVD